MPASSIPTPSAAAVSRGTSPPFLASLLREHSHHKRNVNMLVAVATINLCATLSRQSGARLDRQLMSDAAIALASHYGWPLIGLVGVALLAATCWQWARLRQRNSRLLTTLNSMPQVLGVWSSTARLILCNERYIKMYNLSPELARPGVSLREVIDHRIKVGNFSGNRDQYIADLLSRVAKGKTLTSVREHDGRHISIANRPTGDGGWVATHEDVTEQRVAELQRSSMQEMESRRASTEAAIAGFRERVESVLNSVSDAGQTMQSTAVGLLESSEQASQRAQSAVKASTDASATVT